MADQTTDPSPRCKQAGLEARGEPIVTEMAIEAGPPRQDGGILIILGA